MLLIKNGYVIDPKSEIEGNYDICIKDSKIEKIGENLDVADSKEKVEVIDATGKIVAPGLVDVHVHFRDPGFTNKEDIVSGSKAALRGGFTSVVLMANTKPTVDNEETLRYIIDKGKTTDLNVYTCGNVTVGMKGKEMVDMDGHYAAGAVGFTDDGVPIMDEALVMEAMSKTAALKVPISFHEENPEFIKNNGVNHGKASEYFGIGGSDRKAEISMVERDLELAIKTGAIVDIQHISAKETVELIRKAKLKSPNIHAEATPHHFTLTEDAVIEFGTLAKMNPPLRNKEDREAIIEGITDGTIDLIATDHAPHTAEEKAKPLTEAPSGIIGLETALPLGITKLVVPGHLNMKELLRRMTINPAKMYNLDAGYLAEGGPADLCLIDMNVRYSFDSFVSKASNSPFKGYPLEGKVVKTICKGKVVYSAD